MRNIFWGCAVLLLVLSCSSSDSNNTEQNTPLVWEPQATGEWPVATPEAAGFDRALLMACFEKASSAGLDSLSVYRNGALVGESYFHGFSAASPHHVRSVTKTVTALLIGIALERGDLESVDQPIGPFFADEAPNLSAEKAAITIHNLLTMTSGFEWDESSSSGYTDWANSANPITYVLNKPLAHPPGVSFTYNSGAVHLLAVILTKATGMDTLSYAQSHLWQPLGIETLRWEKLADGNYNGAAGLELRPRDMAKVASVLLAGGTWQGKPVVPATWVEGMGTPTRPGTVTFGALENINYGYLWWLGSGSGHPMQLGWGWGGQFIATFPDLDL
ncbi:MAG: serine hydrolase, partial [Acidobacteria bacterium]|nr:serine hydrolase [Acidobacteriota bacterium]